MKFRASSGVSTCSASTKRDQKSFTVLERLLALFHARCSAGSRSSRILSTVFGSAQGKDDRFRFAWLQGHLHLQGGNRIGKAPGPACQFRVGHGPGAVIVVDTGR